MKSDSLFYGLIYEDTTDKEREGLQVVIHDHDEHWRSFDIICPGWFDFRLEIFPARFSADAIVGWWRLYGDWRRISSGLFEFAKVKTWPNETRWHWPERARWRREFVVRRGRARGAPKLSGVERERGWLDAICVITCIVHGCFSALDPLMPCS